MKLKFDCSKEYGVVLEGGGAKGSYQIGVWKALREEGIKIKGIAGASVGALNGTFMCMDDLDKAEYVWENISYAKVMDIEDDVMEQFQSGSLKNLNLKELAGMALKVIRDGGFDITPLKALIEESIDEDKIRNSNCELYITTFLIDEYKEEILDVKNMPEGQIGDALLASAYFPAFKNEKLRGKRYLDGGSLNNVPVNVLINKGYKDIIVIRIYGIGFDTEKIFRVPEGVLVHHIAPKVSLGGILEFDKKIAKRNMQLGYYDAKRFLYGLLGRGYYFDVTQPESYYFDQMIRDESFVTYYSTLGLDGEEENKGYRFYTEQVFPKLAKKLKLEDNWNYIDLYLGVLETWAKEVQVTRFAIYTTEELRKIIEVKRRNLDSKVPV